MRGQGEGSTQAAQFGTSQTFPLVLSLGQVFSRMNATAFRNILCLMRVLKCVRSNYGLEDSEITGSLHTFGLFHTGPSIE